jgi:DNA polymerase-3 subunit epsilon
MKLAKTLRPGLSSYSLDNLATDLVDKLTTGLGRGRHSALYDATLTALLFIDLLESVRPNHRETQLRNADLFEQPQGSLL